ncbi:MAG: hypothetical protein WCS70_06455 [Verrucomicrobiota bacterium]
MKIKAWLMMAVVVAGAGCGTRPDGPHRDATQPYNPDAPAHPPEGPYLGVAKPNNPEAAGKPVVLLNSDLVRTLAVDQAPTVRRNANGLLEIQAGLRNRTDNQRLRIQVQTLFFNESGQVLYSQPGSEAAWQILVLSPNQTTYYMQQALTPEATRFVVRVRYVNKTR